MAKQLKDKGLVSIGMVEIKREGNVLKRITKAEAIELQENGYPVIHTKHGYFVMDPTGKEATDIWI